MESSSECLNVMIPGKHDLLQKTDYQRIFNNYKGKI